MFDYRRSRFIDSLTYGMHATQRTVMHLLSCLLLLSLTMIACKEAESSRAAGTDEAATGADADTAARLYGVESAVVVYRLLLPDPSVGQMTIYDTLMFDDYGRVEACYGSLVIDPNDLSNKRESVAIFSGDSMWTFDRITKEGMGQLTNRRRVLCDTFIPVWKEAREMWPTMNTQGLAQRTILGREAAGYSMELEEPTKIWVWNGIPLAFEMRDVAGNKSFGEAIALEVDASVPAERFAVPAGMTIRGPGVPAQ